VHKTGWATVVVKLH